VALGALALDEAVGQEHVLLGVEELLDGAHLDQAVGLQVAVDLARPARGFRARRCCASCQSDVKAVQVLLAAGGDVGHELLRRLAGLFGGNHDGRAVGVVGADEVHRVALHALEPHPDVGLDVFHDVADVEVAVGVGQGGGDEEPTPPSMVRTPLGNESMCRDATTSSRSLGEITNSSNGRKALALRISGGTNLMVWLMRRARSTSTASASRKMLESACPAICAMDG
jgi:hypothetical protein